MSYLKILIILLLCSIKPILLNKNTNNITLKQGTIRGVIKNLKMARNSNLRVAIFKGIPYAAPPIGELRFMPTVGAPSWFGVKIADHFAPVCPQIFPDVDKMTDYRKRQFENLKIFLENQSEDCLYLNIYAPVHDNELNNRKYPVMLFIHGESFEWNSGNPYDGSILSAYGNVVVVTINFRLGIFGFLKAGTEELARSNFGLVDQIASLIWIKDNIAAFGGDSNSVTIFGHGTGAVCAGLLMISPMVLLGNDRLFHRAILMGGSALSDWALAGNPGEVTYQMSKLLNCQLHDDFAECLRRKRVDEIMRAAANVVTPDYKTRFGPIVDSLLVPNQPRKSMTQYNDIFKRFELMYGVAEMESINILDSSHLIHGFLQTKRDQELRNYFRFRCEIKPEFCLQRTLDEYSQNNAFSSKFNVRRHILYNVPKNVLKYGNNALKNKNNVTKNEQYQQKNANNAQNMNNVPKNGNNASKNGNYEPKNENNVENTFNVQKGIKNVQNIIDIQKNGNNVQKGVKNVQNIINIPENGNNVQNTFNVQKRVKNVQKNIKNVRIKRNEEEPDPATVARDVFLDILSDARSVAPILEMGHFHSAVNMQSYFYVFKHKTLSRYYIREKTYSGDELDYIFGIPFVSDSSYTEQEKLFSEILMMYFSNFAETGNPNVPRKEGFSSMSPAFWAQFDVEWPEFDNKQEQYLELEIPPQPSDHYRSTKMKYWHSIFPNLISSNFTYLPSKSSPPPSPPKFFRPPPKNIYENFEKPLNNEEADVFGRVVEKGRGRPENVVEAGVFGKIVDAPSKEKEDNSMMNIVAVVGGLFLLANFVLLVILYVKCRNRKKITTTNEEKLHPDIDDISPLTGCNITRIFSTSSSSTPNPSNRSPTTTSNYPLHRQISGSTIDAHTKVRDWITNEIIHKYSPKIFRKNPPKTTQQPQSPPKTSTITPRPKLPKISVAVDATPASRNYAAKSVVRRSFTPPPKLRTFRPDSNLTKSFDSNAICDVTFTSDYDMKFNYDINVTSRDDSISPPSPLTSQQSLMIIKRRNCPKVLPEFPEKRRSCMEFTSPKIAPIQFFHTVEDEPEIVCNNLYFGPLLPKHDKIHINETKIGVNDAKKSANKAKIDANEATLSTNDAENGVNKTKCDLNEAKYDVNEAKSEANKAKCCVYGAKCGLNEATYGSNDTKGGANETKCGVNEAKDGLNEAKNCVNEIKCGIIKAKSCVNEAKYGVNEAKVGVKGVVRRLDPKVVIRPGMKLSEKTTPVHRVIAPDNQPCPGVKLEEIYAKIDIKPTEITPMLNKNSSSSESSPSDLSDTGTVVKKA